MSEAVMEDKVNTILAEKMNRMQMFLFIMLMIISSYGISTFLDNHGIRISENIILILFVIAICILGEKFKWFSPEYVDVIFQENKVIFRRKNRKKEIFYDEIKEVEKMMVINRYHVEKGYYRIKIKTKKGSYAVYSGEDSDKKLDFLQTDISQIYLEFQKRGVKCC